MPASPEPTTRAKFDLDLSTGQVWERLFHSLITEMGAIEAKRDGIAWHSGFAFVEQECAGRPSGLAVTEAAWYAFALDNERGDIETAVLVSVPRLRHLCDLLRGTKNYNVPGGDGGQTRGVLVPLAWLIDPKV